MQVKVLNLGYIFCVTAIHKKNGKIEAKNDWEKLFLFAPQKNMNSAQFAG